MTYFKYFCLYFSIAVSIFITGCSGAPLAVPIINSFSANPPTITSGDSSILSWSITNATNATIDQGVGSVAVTTGTTSVLPIVTTTYTLTATNNAGSITATTMVSVSSAVTVSYNSNGATSGTVPVDPLNPYQIGEIVTVLGNTGNLARINDGGTSYRFTGWNTQTDGSGTDLGEGSTFTIGTSNMTLYAQWTPYILLDTGPAGGYIFYDKGYYSNGWRYLEASPSYQSASAPWGCYGILITGADGTAIGTGKQNTIDIEAGCTVLYTAADICANLILGDYSDWFLPSKDELNLMYTNLKTAGVGGFTNGTYWSSSEYDADYAWVQMFSNGYQYLEYEFNAYWVRAVRTF